MNLRYLFLLLPLTGCGGYEPISSSELALLRADAGVNRRVGRFTWHSEGERTWRFDTVTGDVCLLLASEAAWKTSKSHAC